MDGQLDATECKERQAHQISIPEKVSQIHFIKNRNRVVYTLTFTELDISKGKSGERSEGKSLCLR